MDNIKGGIVQERSFIYHDDFLHNEKIHWNRYNPCFTRNTMNHHSKDDREKSDVFIAAESMNFYRQMSGIYAGKGLNRDSNEAYRKKVLEERDYCKKMLKVLRRDGEEEEMPGKWHYRFELWGTYVTQGLGFGYKWWSPCVCFLLLVIVFWVIFQISAETSFYDLLEGFEHLGFSMNNALSPFEKYYNVVNIFVSSLQSTLGILLVGFLGFVVANKIRNNS